MAAPDEPATEPTALAGPVDLIGRTLGKFKIVDQLGRGGSGDVYRAEQIQLGRTVVVKVLRAEVAWTPNRVERFLREARLASKLDHPYAAHIYAFGAEPDGVLWIAMEHVRGVTLDELVQRRGALPPQVFAPLFVRLCEVVHSAHELGIVHRDIKGGNVMVLERAGQLLPKLLDFGIAKGEDGQPSPGVEGDGAVLTGHGMMLGSPQYMSPEQWQRPADVDARTDIYALGVLAYRCSCGRLPFGSTDRLALGRAHIHEPVPPLPDIVAPAVADAIYRALGKQPAERWPTAIAFGQAIAEAANTAEPETVPLFDPGTRDAWLRAGPQPIADAIAHLAGAATTVEADAALRELVAIACRWLAVLALARVPNAGAGEADPMLRERVRGVLGRDDAAPWLELAHAAVAASPEPLPGLVAALAGAAELAVLAARLDDRDRPRTAAALAADIAAVSDALRPLEPLLAYQLVLGLGGSTAESWQGPRRRDRERVVVWGEGLATAEVALLDSAGEVVARLSPLAQVLAPFPSAEPELFLLWRSGRGSARLVAAPWGFERDDERVGQRLAALTTESAETLLDVADERSPYPGLAAYGVADAERFFGREREIEVLANRLVRSPLLAVLGPSGVGKSSFVHAGLAARLGEHYHVITMRPGRHPAQTLGAHGDLRALGEASERGVVVIVDQLEELVTLCADAGERRAFAEALAAAADGPSAPVRVIASLRDDFATVLESEDALRGRFDVFVLASPPTEALRRIVVEPARRSGVTVEPRVVDDIVAEVAGRPASLPLVSFVASRLWQTRDRAAHRIAHDAYTTLGGVAGALAGYADEVYASLGRRDREVVRDLFARLVSADGTRVPWPRRELEQAPEMRAVIAHLVDARLLVMREDDGADVVEIVHECLAERWPQLARWRSEDAADRALLDDVRAAARRWHDGGRRVDLLWRGRAVGELARLAARTSALTESERAFADATVAAQRRTRRWRRGALAGAMAVLAAIASVMAYLGAVANDNRSRAEDGERHARAAAQLAEDRLTQSLVAQGKRELNDGRSLHALAYFAEAMRRGADSIGLRTMVSIAARGWRDTLVVVPGMSGSAIAGSPRGWIAAGDRSGRVRWWSDAGAPLGELAVGIGQIVTLRGLGDGGLVATGRDGVARVDAEHRVVARVALASSPWYASAGPRDDELVVIGDKRVDVYGSDGKLRRHTELADDGSIEPLFDRSGRYMFYGERGRIARLDLETMAARTVTVAGYGTLAGAGDGSVFAYLDRASRDIHVLASDGAPLRVIHPTVRGAVLAISPTGDRIVTLDAREAEVFDASGNTLESYEIEGDEQVVLVRGEDLWTTGKNGVLRHYSHGVLRASIPLSVTDLNLGVIAGNAIGVLASDQTLYIARAAAEQLREEPPVCEHARFGADGIATTYECGAVGHVYVGRHHIGDAPVQREQAFAAYDDATGVAAISTPGTTAAYDRDGKPLAHTGHYGPVAIADADHVLVLDGHRALARWTLSTGDWHELLPIEDGVAIAALGAGGYAVGRDDGTFAIYRDGREIHHLALGRASWIVASADARWLAVQLDRGATAIVDAATGELARTLEPADGYGAAASFDPTGELIVRATRGTITIWDRASGEDLVFGLDVLRSLQNARALPDGRLETNGRGVGLLDIPRDARPTTEIAGDIKCRVPLAVVDGRLEPRAASCKLP